MELRPKSAPKIVPPEQLSNVVDATRRRITALTTSQHLDELRQQRDQLFEEQKQRNLQLKQQDLEFRAAYRQKRLDYIEDVHQNRLYFDPVAFNRQFRDIQQGVMERAGSQDLSDSQRRHMHQMKTQNQLMQKREMSKQLDRDLVNTRQSRIQKINYMQETYKEREAEYWSGKLQQAEAKRQELDGLQRVVGELERSRSSGTY